MIAISPSSLASDDRFTRQLEAAETAKAEAHEAYLRVSGNIAQTLSNQLAFQMALIEVLMAAADPAAPDRSGEASRDALAPALDRAQCLEFAVGSIARGARPRVRRDRRPSDARPAARRAADAGRPDPGDRGRAALDSTSGRVITEHDVLPGGWYLDCGRIPTCIAVEAGQADLFLSGYLGIDFVTKGLAVYRLLDAVVTFHRGLPGPGEVIRYDIQIDRVLPPGGHAPVPVPVRGDGRRRTLDVDARRLRGVLHGRGARRGQGDRARRRSTWRRAPGVRPDDWVELVPMAVESYDDRAGRRAAPGRPGRRVRAARSRGSTCHDPVRLPGGRMTLVHRVPHLDPAGGRFGLGLIRAEADIDPDDWFMTCHFVDDRVMPGTLMYECCLHTLRIYLMRMGWVGEQRPRSSASRCRESPAGSSAGGRSSSRRGRSRTKSRSRSWATAPSRTRSPTP